MRSGLRRAVALLVSVFLFQLVLVEAGFACGMPAAAGDRGADGPMLGMVMPGMAVAGTAIPGQTRSSAAAANPSGRAVETTPAPEPGPCHFPWAPAGCHDMAPCAPAAMPTPPIAEAAPPAPPPRHAQVRAATVRPPPSVLTAPEPPPPRA